MAGTVIVVIAFVASGRSWPSCRLLYAPLSLLGTVGFKGFSVKLWLFNPSPPFFLYSPPPFPPLDLLLAKKTLIFFGLILYPCGLLPHFHSFLFIFLFSPSFITISLERLAARLLVC